MTLIVETGTAAADSEAYASVAYCDAYHASIGNVAWAALSTELKEQALRRATMFMSQMYRSSWKGTRVNSTQALDWPRYNVQLPDLGFANVIMPDVVPVLVQQASAELALIASTTTLNPSTTQRVESEQVGPIKVVYDNTSPQTVQYPAVRDILQPLLLSGNGTMRLFRT